MSTTTAPQRPKTANNGAPLTVEDNVELGLLLGHLAKLHAGLRRGLLAAVTSIEEFEGLDPRTCKHCGKPIR